MTRINADFAIRRDRAAVWASKNPILKEGEPGFETDTKRLKIGDGVTVWENLSYVNMGDASVPSPELYDHLHDETPHPVYDEGPDWVLIYENAKV